MPRNPFPFPRYENDHSFTGSRTCQKLHFDNPTHLAQNDEPWRRLHNTSTLASDRRNIRYDDNAPMDSLDIHLKSTYDHHRDLFQNKNQTVIQKETVVENSGTLKYKEQPEASVCETANKGIKMWTDPQKVSIYSFKGTIESPHTALTNPGYSRKHDGGFYST